VRAIAAGARAEAQVNSEFRIENEEWRTGFNSSTINSQFSLLNFLT
jgi:hypothetical protein